VKKFFFLLNAALHWPQRTEERKKKGRTTEMRARDKRKTDKGRETNKKRNKGRRVHKVKYMQEERRNDRKG
jgi:hypothetical protein